MTPEQHTARIAQLEFKLHKAEHGLALPRDEDNVRSLRVQLEEAKRQARLASEVAPWITAELVRSILDYNPLTGAFTWKITKPPKGIIGTPAGGVSNGGYLRISIGARKYLAHRLAWLMMTGKWPLDQLDHINGVRTDNRWSNLRAATNAQNTINSDYANRTGLRGVYLHKRSGWAASIKTNGHRIHLGYFKTPEEAHAVYCEAAHEFHGEFARAAIAKVEGTQS